MTPYRDAATVTSAEPRVAVRWVPREVPLAVRGVAAGGDAARALAARLVDLDDASLARCRGVAAGDGLVLLAEEPPWVDGATWMGRDPDAPGWLLPTARRTDLPAALVLRALAAVGARPSAPHAMWPAGEVTRVVSLADARPIARARLARWLEGRP